jgi:transcription elongation GreA/GreB family factor
MEEISEMVRCVEDIEETIRLLLERLQNKKIIKQMKVVTRPSVTTHKAVEIQDSDKENEEGVGVV